MRRPLLFLLPLLLAAGPATRPVPRDQTEYSVAPAKARFRTPKLWARNPTQGGDPATLFLFDIAPKKKPAGVQFQQYVTVEIKPAADKLTTLEAVTADARKQIDAMHPGTKFSRDADVTFGGRTVHAFYWTFQRKLTYANPEGGTSVSKVDTDRVLFVWPEKGAVCQVGLVADTRFIPSLTQKAEPVAASIWFEE